jgi:uncharacterized protein YaaR (DUF327 family)
MEVQRIHQTSVLNRGLKEAASKDSISFNAVLGKKQADVVQDSLSKKMQEIESYGNKLVESRTVENLRKYKKSIKDFMNYAVKNGLDAKNQGGFNQWGSSRIYKLVKQVDSKLIDITNAVLDKEKKSIDILGLVGEVKGMLINFYI